MIRLFSAMVFIVLFQQQTWAQKQPMQDVLRLKDGWVIRGTLLERTDSLVRIRTRDGNEFVFSTQKVNQLTTEPLWEGTGKPARWLASLELGPLIAGKTTQNGVTTAAFSFQTVVVYCPKPWLGAGMGVGADLYATQTLLPLFVTLRGDWWRTRAANWFYFLDAGYGQNITQTSQAAAGFRGGGLYAAGIGWRIPFSSNAGFLLSIGYRYQHTSYLEDGNRQAENYQRVALRAGFYL